MDISLNANSKEHLRFEKTNVYLELRVSPVYTTSKVVSTNENFNFRINVHVLPSLFLYSFMFDP